MPSKKTKDPKVDAPVERASVKWHVRVYAGGRQWDLPGEGVAVVGGSGENAGICLGDAVSVQGVAPAFAALLDMVAAAQEAAPVLDED